MRQYTDAEKREIETERLDRIRRIAPMKERMKPIIEALMEGKISNGKAAELCAELASGLPLSAYIHASGEPDFFEQIATLRETVERREELIRLCGEKIASLTTTVEQLALALAGDKEPFAMRLLHPDPIPDEPASVTARDLEALSAHGVVQPAGPEEGVGDLGGERLAEGGEVVIGSADGGLDAEAVEPLEVGAWVRVESDGWAVGPDGNLYVRRASVRKLGDFNGIQLDYITEAELDRTAAATRRVREKIAAAFLAWLFEDGS